MVTNTGWCFYFYNKFEMRARTQRTTQLHFSSRSFTGTHLRFGPPKKLSLSEKGLNSLSRLKTQSQIPSERNMEMT